MKPIGSVVHELAIASRVWRRARRRRAAGDGAAAVTPGAFRSALARIVASAPRSILREHAFLEVAADQPPWLDTGLDLVAGEQLTWFAHGRTYLSRALDIWAGPHFQLWARVSENGTIFRGVRSSHSFATPRPGRLFLASYFPGEWADATGRLATDPAQYRKVSGRMAVLVLRWAPGVSPADGLAALAREGDAFALGLVTDELDRLRAPVVPPEGWQHLWFLGPSEIFSAASDAHGRPCIRCDTQEDVAILQREARVPLTASTRLRWRWKVDELPAELPEDALPTHDYMSIAVEFENGQDLTYYWSSSLRAGTIYRCPLPTWTERETHWVLRSGAAGLGAWHDEERAVLDDYRRAIGGPTPAAIERVWLIALSVFQRRRGRSDWADITLGDGARTIRLCD